MVKIDTHYLSTHKSHQASQLTSTFRISTQRRSEGTNRFHIKRRHQLRYSDSRIWRKESNRNSSRSTPSSTMPRNRLDKRLLRYAVTKNIILHRFLMSTTRNPWQRLASVVQETWIPRCSGEQPQEAQQETQHSSSLLNLQARPSKNPPEADKEAWLKTTVRALDLIKIIWETVAWKKAEWCVHNKKW